MASNVPEPERVMYLKVLLTTMLLTASLALPAGASGQQQYWQTIGNCGHHHGSQFAKKKIVRIMHGPYVNRKAVRHLNRCVATKAKRRYLTGVVQDAWLWRESHRYEILDKRYAALYAGFPSWVHSHLESIAACESGGNPRAISPGGAYRGKYQFSFSTWGVVGGSGDPASAPESEQDYRAALLLTRHGAGHWPVCG